MHYKTVLIRFIVKLFYLVRLSGFLFFNEIFKGSANNPTNSLQQDENSSHTTPGASPHLTICQHHSMKACPDSTCSGPHVLVLSTTKRPSVGGTSGSAHGKPLTAISHHHPYPTGRSEPPGSKIFF